MTVEAYMVVLNNTIEGQDVGAPLHIKPYLLILCDLSCRFLEQGVFAGYVIDGAFQLCTFPFELVVALMASVAILAVPTTH